MLVVVDGRFELAVNRRLVLRIGASLKRSMATATLSRPLYDTRNSTISATCWLQGVCKWLLFALTMFSRG